jgi:hypothetical protein
MEIQLKNGIIRGRRHGLLSRLAVGEQCQERLAGLFEANLNDGCSETVAAM